ncbi:integration host factor subunit beta [Myxococcus sp. RHSTA-1-4]|uniref:integration host factor subunit beta n=1 Tax=Myxococcus sp. RHSTA-1-4 TaxID=2874601 RepID=UPI001CBC9765|nr:integration host factor subunit beta [Myxococcus sp. RHSTA-1-4]MBZ4418532.1 integration host factor subunit beta [Myxococcus sp. RHSTA-1-4]
MTRSELIERIVARAPHVPRREVEAIVHAVFDCMCQSLVAGKRIELRGFGVFSVRTRRARTGRNPKTGQSVSVPERRTLSFAAGKELRERLNAAPSATPAAEAPPEAFVPPGEPPAPLAPPPLPTASAFATPATG